MDDVSTKARTLGDMADVEWLDETEARAWRGYLRMNTVLLAELNRDLQRDSGLSGADYDVLVILSEDESQRLRLRDLGAQLLWEKSRLSHHITRMQNRGLVRREECASDARGAFVVMTPQGRRAVEEAAPLHVARVRRHFFDQLSSMQVRTLAEAAESVLEGLRSSH